MAVRDIVQAAAGVGGAEYQISRSLRFNSADSAYLNRTPASAGNRKTWTWSGWVKRSALNLKTVLFNAYTDNDNRFTFQWQTDNTFILFNAAGSQVTPSARLDTSAVYRDVSAWYHIVLSVDTTQATSTNRIKIYVNGQQITSFTTTTYPSQNGDLYINTTATHYLGNEPYSGVNETANYYLTEINFIDGQALTPSDFGETDATTGVWKPKAYTGTYGTNGFYLDFSDNSSTTALGYDAAGSNDWTPNNFSVTAGAGNDSLVDTPTPYGTDTGAGGEVRGNYCTWNPLDAFQNANTGTITNGNLTRSDSTSTNTATRGTFFVSSGKWYYEVTVDALGSTSNIAVALSGNTFVAINGSGTIFGASVSGSGTYTTGDILGVAVDIDSNTVYVYKNGALTWTLTPTTALTSVCPSVYDGTTSATAFTVTANFGQRPFAYTAPSGFKALCTQNLPTPTVVQGDDYFNTVLYEGNGSTQSITGVGFQPDFVWGKSRTNGTASNRFFDAVRGVQKALYSDLTSAEATESGLTSFDSDGFTLGSQAGMNQSSNTFVAWNWNAGGSNATNTDGTITSTVRANPTAGFSIVSYTGTGANATVGHGLGVAPKMVIVKDRDSGTFNWQVYHAELGNTKAVQLNLTNAAATSSAYWNDTSPTSSVVSLGTATGINSTTNDYIAYCFAEVEGFSKFGSYTGNGSTNGPFVYCGFRPAFVMVKNTTDNGVNWLMWDNKMNAYNVVTTYLLPNRELSQFTDLLLDMVSNGFKPRVAGGTGINQSGKTYIFMAFAENPFKYSLAR